MTNGVSSAYLHWKGELDDGTPGVDVEGPGMGHRTCTWPFVWNGPWHLHFLAFRSLDAQAIQGLATFPVEGPPPGG